MENLPLNSWLKQPIRKSYLRKTGSSSLQMSQIDGNSFSKFKKSADPIKAFSKAPFDAFHSFSVSESVAESTKRQSALSSSP
jgi:hypothetical protein